MGTRFHTQGTGSVGRLRLELGTPPRLATGQGLTYWCKEGVNAGVAANVPSLTELDLTGDRCTWRIVAPATAGTPSVYRLATPHFDTSVTAKMRDAHALLTLTATDGRVSLRGVDAEGSTDPVIADLSVSYERLGGTPSRQELAECLQFGSGKLRALHANATDLHARLDADVGDDEVARPRILVEGTGGAALAINLTRDAEDPTSTPSTSACGRTSAPGRAACLNATVNAPLSGAFELIFHETGTSVPGTNTVDKEGNFAILTSQTDSPAGRIRLQAPHAASLVLDRVPAQTGLRTLAEFAYETSLAAKPLAFDLRTRDGVLRATLDQVPTHVAGRLDILQEDAGWTHGNFTYEGEPTQLKVEQHATMGIFHLTLDLPARIEHLDFALHEEKGDPELELSLLASAPTRLRMDRRDEWGTLTRVVIDKLPPTVLNATLTMSTCGVNAKLTLGAAVDFLLVNHLPTAQPSQNADLHVSPGCPTAKGTQSGSDGTHTRLYAEVRGIPTGTLDLKLRIGNAAGEVLLKPLSAPIGSAFVHTRTLGSKSTTTVITAESVTLRTIQWDLDGHTNYPGVPKAVFLDSDRKTTGRITIDVRGDEPLRVDTGGRVQFDGFQIKTNGPDFDLLPPRARIQFAGCMILLDEGLTVRLQSWWKDPMTRAYVWAKNFDPTQRWRGYLGEWGRC